MFTSTSFTVEPTQPLRAAWLAAREVGAPERVIGDVVDAARIVPGASPPHVVQIVCLTRVSLLPIECPVDLVLIYNALEDLAAAARDAPAVKRTLTRRPRRGGP